MGYRVRIPSDCTRVAALCASTLASLLAGCGGGPGSDSPPAPPTARTVQGTAAVGAALSKANVQITDTAGAAVCQEATLVTSDTGTYSCTLQIGKTAPFIIVVTDPSGAVAPLVSVAATAPSDGTPLTVNATPLTTAIVAQLSPDKNAPSVVNHAASLDTTALQTVTAKVLSQLSDVLSALSAPADYNPFSTPITAATASISGNTADHIVDVLKISTVNGATLIATVDHPDTAVVIADALHPGHRGRRPRGAQHPLRGCQWHCRQHHHGGQALARQRHVAAPVRLVAVGQPAPDRHVDSRVAAPA
jgi:hypothetical protein